MDAQGGWTGSGGAHRDTLSGRGGGTGTPKVCGKDTGTSRAYGKDTGTRRACTARTHGHSGHRVQTDRWTDAQYGLGGQELGCQPVPLDGHHHPALAEEISTGHDPTDGPVRRGQVGHRQSTESTPKPDPPYPKIRKKKVSRRSKGKSSLRSLLKTAAMVSGREDRNEGVGLGVSTPKMSRGRVKGRGGASCPPCLALLAVEHGQEPKHEGATGGSKEAAPVIPHGKVGGHHLDAEKHPWKNRERDQGEV